LTFFLSFSDPQLLYNRCAEHNATTMAVMDEIPQQAAVPQPIDIEAWTEEATAAMGSVAIAVPGEVVGVTTVTLAIPLDDDALASGGPWALRLSQRKAVFTSERHL
jgi:hypothetical protein